MPAVLDDPTAPVLPYHQPGDSGYNGHYLLPSAVLPRRSTLRDRITTATLIPFSSLANVPLSLLSYLTAAINIEIERGDTFAMAVPFTIDLFGNYWFSNFGAVMLLGDWGATVEDAYARLNDSINVEKDWEKECLGSFYIKPNYPGRSSHVCNGSFLVTDGARNRGVGRLMGEGYLEWAPKLNYSYSVFNLVYETNVASCRIWDALGFKRIGRVKGCGHLKSHDEPVDAIIYGRELNSQNPDDFISEERFDKIKFYLKHQKYPDGADRAEKSRLRSAATHYRLVLEDSADGSGTQEEKLYLKDKEVVGDPQKQYEIARTIHRRQHEGINKTTARVAEKYHWVRIKETATLVIKNCPECSDPAKPITESTAPSVEASSPQSQPVPSDTLPSLTALTNDSQFTASEMSLLTQPVTAANMLPHTSPDPQLNNISMLPTTMPSLPQASLSMNLPQQNQLLSSPQSQILSPPQPQPELLGMHTHQMPMMDVTAGLQQQILAFHQLPVDQHMMASLGAFPMTYGVPQAPEMQVQISDPGHEVLGDLSGMDHKNYGAPGSM